jgi:hypothetical protein
MTPTTDLESPDEYTLPTAEALLAGTLALMTGCVQGADEHRGLMSAKIASNLAQLSEHTALSCEMRRMLARLQTRWQTSGGGWSASGAALAWVSGSGTLQ